MTPEYPRTPLQALNMVNVEVDRLTAGFPAKSGKILSSLDEMSRLLEKHREQFPLNRVVEEVDAMRDQISNEYDDPNCEIDRRSSVYEQVVGLRHRVAFSMEFFAASKIFESVERKFERIDSVLPTQNYGVRQLLAHLPVDRIGGLPTKRRLEAALNHFERQEYKLALREIGEAGEALFTFYKSCFSRSGCNEVPREDGPALLHIRRWMLDAKSVDQEGFSFGPSGRTEWFLLSMFETLHYLRNAVSHPSETDDRLPKWQCQRRALFRRHQSALA